MYKGQIEGFPEEIVERMLECQVEQDNFRDITVFERNRDACAHDGGFNWNITVEGDDFWCDINEKCFDTFFKKYPKKSTTYTGKLAKYPKEIAELIITRHMGDRDISRDEAIEDFQLSGLLAAFNWKETIEGTRFWKEIDKGNYEVFYKMYPKDTTINNLKTNQNENEKRIIESEQSRIRGAVTFGSVRRRSVTTGCRYSGNTARIKKYKTSVVRGKVIGKVRFW